MGATVVADSPTAPTRQREAGETCVEAEEGASLVVAGTWVAGLVSSEEGETGLETGGIVVVGGESAARTRLFLAE